MKYSYTVELMQHKWEFFEISEIKGKKSKKHYSLNGYAFMHQGHCMIIVYGEARRDALIHILDNPINI